MVSRTTLKPRMCDCVYLCVLELTLLASKLSLALQSELHFCNFLPIIMIFLMLALIPSRNRLSFPGKSNYMFFSLACSAVNDV